MLPVGSPVPRVALPDQHGTTTEIGPDEPAGVRLIVFFPAAFTPVCAGELRQLRDDLVPTLPAEVTVLGVSCDSMLTLRAFADVEGFTFPLLSDFWPHGVASSAFDTFDEELGTARRTTYAVDGTGMIRWGTVSALSDPRDVGEYRSVLTDLIG